MVLSGKVEGAFDKEVEGDGGAPYFDDVVEEAVGADEFVGHGVHAAVVAVFEQVDVGPVGRVALGRAAEFATGEEAVAVVAAVVLLCEDGLELVGTVEDFLTDGGELCGRGHVDAAAEGAAALQAVVALPELEVVAGDALGAVASDGEEAGDVGLVGALVGGETEVAVDAVDALLGLQVAEGGVEGRHGVDEGLGEEDELVADGGPARLVVVEPVAIVVHQEVVEEGESVGMDGHVKSRIEKCELREV